MLCSLTFNLWTLVALCAVPIMSKQPVVTEFFSVVRKRLPDQHPAKKRKVEVVQEEEATVVEAKVGPEQESASSHSDSPACVVVEAVCDHVTTEIYSTPQKVAPTENKYEMSRATTFNVKLTNCCVLLLRSPRRESLDRQNNYVHCHHILAFRLLHFT